MNAFLRDAPLSPLLPADVQQRADAELGAAWRRAKAAAMPGDRIVLWSDAGSEVTYAQALHRNKPEPEPAPDPDYDLVAILTRIGPYPPSAGAAMQDLAEALEARKEAGAD